MLDIQKNLGIVQTGEFDEATIRLLNKQLGYVTIAFDAKESYFTLLNKGDAQIEYLNYDGSNLYSEHADLREYNIILNDGRDFNDFASMGYNPELYFIITSPGSEVDCTYTDTSGDSVMEFSILPNKPRSIVKDLYELGSYDNISLNCGVESFKISKREFVITK